ncbi:MAG TPA: universal stress protein [Thermoanaerobaculia bacterium]|nr:universal stress protein [Thermoanaerobaculia bacterium]
MIDAFQPKRLLAATDLSESNIAALRYARMLAERYRTTLTVMYSDLTLRQAELRESVEEFVDPILRGVPYEVFVTGGSPSTMIARTAAEKNADLLVIGTHGQHGWRRALLGSVAEAVLHTAHIPVLTVSRHTPLPVQGPVAITRIVCPTNFGGVAGDSLRMAGSIAAAFNAELIVVHVVEELAGADEGRIRRQVGPELARVCSFRPIVVRGDAAERILDCADDVGADLLVVGAQRKLFRDETVIGSTTEHLVRCATCPVLTVTRAAASRSLVQRLELVEAR